MKDLELKYHSETGTHATEEFVHKSNLTDGYIEWLEDLAEKYLKQDLSRVSKVRLEDELHRRKLRELNKLLAIERNKQNPLQ